MTSHLFTSICHFIDHERFTFLHGETNQWLYNATQIEYQRRLKNNDLGNYGQKFANDIPYTNSVGYI